MVAPFLSPFYDACAEEKIERLERECARQQSPGISSSSSNNNSSKFENFLSASNQQAELAGLRQIILDPKND
jgi:hypothetical protein